MAEPHDPGGKVSTALPANINGDAVFHTDRYRPSLRRWVGSTFPDRYVLWIGMNPSTASARINDPTVTREWGFTTRLGYSGYWKCNLSDYRATSPKKLLEDGLELESPINRKTILDAAAGAEVVICCWGAVNRALKPIAASLLADLAAAKVQLYCLGKTQAGHPKHPLYLAANTSLEMFP